MDSLVLLALPAFLEDTGFLVSSFMYSRRWIADLLLRQNALLC